MAYEKRWAAVPPQNFTANGTDTGKITVADASLFKVKQQVIVVSNTQTNLNLQVQRIDTATELYVGPPGSSISTRTDISAYTTADAANIYAIEQPRSSVPEEQVERLTYEEEPTVARRVVLVDKIGNKIDDDNPLPVNIDDVTFTGDINVKLTDKDNDPDPGDVADIVRIGDGVDQLAINTDGSINVNIVSSSDGELISVYNEVNSVAANILTNITTYTVPIGKTSFLSRVEVSGSNIATYEITLNGSTIAKKRTFYGSSLSEGFEFVTPFEAGIELIATDSIIVKVMHGRPDVGDFAARIQVREV